MTDRLATGSSALNAVLGGGFPRNAINLVIGLPGTGKTVLAQQCIFHTATEEQPAIYLSTVSEPLEKILRFGQTLSFFEPTAVGGRVRYDDLGEVLAQQGLSGVLDRVRSLLREMRPGIMVIDSFKALHPYAEDEGEFRRFLHTLAGTVSAFPVTSLWVGEYEESETAVAPEFAVADSIISLTEGPTQESRFRSIQVRKLRGSDFRPGEHAYRITTEGLQVFPRLVDPREQPQRFRPVDNTRRLSSGIQALDDMLSDGYRPGATTVVAGPPGSGKTLMGLHFVFGGVAAGERGLIATLQERPAQLEQLAATFGWSIKESPVTVMYRSPVNLHLDEWAYQLLDTVAKTGATRILVDSLSDLQLATNNPVEFRTYLYALLHRLAAAGVSLMATMDLPELVGISRLTENSPTHLVDNVVLLQYTGLATTVNRTLTVLKTRTSTHDLRVREFEITPKGIVLTAGQPPFPLPS
ncbi:hypothetical protein JQS43_04185 [Natronosporangium hydrolyticum]|uniref:non-specific serine/threonine protein kinase n=1 Tax=Natronosporangium hydrolyticum TaxID=2811111 RepID=A0A895YNP5_9ACTN|nr:ATPase domain-containing protein [Natronosporangium hydrolyticum]QSB15558.1 hypothetical protein JQS43_04185 [Natronosporangium hydrolyticum]